MSSVSSLRTLSTLQSLLKKNAFTGLKCLSVRFAGHETKVTPVNLPPNDHINFVVKTLDDLPEPENFYTDYRTNQKKYWRDFIFGVTSLVVSTYVIYKYELIFMNAFPPELPPKEERIKSFWEEPDDDDEDD